MSSSIGSELAYAARTLTKRPGFAAAAIGTIALGIGITTAIYGVVNTVLLRPLPYPAAQRLVLVQSDLTKRHVSDFPLPPGDLTDMRDRGTLFEDVAAITSGPQPLAGDGGGPPEQITLAGVTTDFLPLLGARLQRGRAFQESDATPLPPPPNLPPGVAPPPAPPLPPAMAILSYGFWQRRYGGDPAVIGRILRMGFGTAEVVGVLAPDFDVLLPPNLNIARHPDVYIPLRIDFAKASRINVFLRFVGRLKPGVTIPQAQSQVDGIVADLRQRFPIKETAGLKWRVEPMAEYLVAAVRPAILALMGGVMFVLLIACANVGNLLLVRASGRERELVVRAALGANRWDLARQVLAESVVIAGTGAVCGVALALLGLRLLRTIAPPTLPRVDLVGINLGVLLFTAFVTLLAAVLFGIVPALRASRPDATAALRSPSRTSGLSHHGRLPNIVVAVEVALSFVLLVGAGLLVRSTIALSRIDPGFDPDRVLTITVLPPATVATPDQGRVFMQQLRDRLAALPGVQSVTAAFPLPLDGQVANARWGTEAARADPSQFQQCNVHFVLPGYFAALHTRLIEGRVFTEADNDPKQVVTVIDQDLARLAFPGRRAVGERLWMRVRSNDPEPVEIIGVVEHERHEGLATPGPAAAFFTDGFAGFGAATHWALRTTGDPAALAAGVRGAVASLTADTPVAQLKSLASYVADAMAPTRFALVLIGVFAAIAAVLAAVGLYGVLSTAVRQRTAEIGIRMTFGASRGSIFQLILKRGLALSGIGVAAGIAAAALLTRVIRSQLVGVTPTDPITFIGIALFLVGLAVVACWVPASRAATVDPTVALREE